MSLKVLKNLFLCVVATSVSITIAAESTIPADAACVVFMERAGFVGCKVQITIYNRL